MTLEIAGFGPLYFGLATSTSFTAGSHDWSMYGPVPTGCCVANVPLGWKTPVASTVPASASYFFSAAGLAMPKFGSPIAEMKDDERRVRFSVTSLSPLVVQLL